MDDLREALLYLERFTNYERTAPSLADLGLSRMEELLSRIGSPQAAWRSIHVAGTKGKGSTCALTAGILKAAGFRVGLYSSPHLIDLRERIQINGQWVSESEFIEAIEVVRAAESALTTRPTYFEMFTAAAFWLFARHRIDVAVVEVGLGGRLDATNVLSPEISAITPVSFDHMQVLGSTLSQIAQEKAGIIKQNTPVVVAPQPREVRDQIERVAKERSSPLRFVEDQVQWKILSQSPDGQKIQFKISKKDMEVFLPLLGEHQAVNLATALAILERFSISHAAKGPRAIREGARSVVWPGRFQIAGRNPWMVLDGAHNAASARALAQTLRSVFPRARIHCVVGIAADKDVGGFAQALRTVSERVIATRAPTPRALDAAELGESLKQWFPGVEIEPDPARAVERAKQSAGPEDCVAITGSLYLVGFCLREGAVCHG
ncbi:MAG: bifunctional folylpolyglutamate synthase/dihydrofolate synthase [Candidatus Omnitrophica bacterium]|nr:bifunctional folylpolyglutamate synthase/dihydrofolate synthase [Candidatus Omnitrophota bacterium]